MSRTIEEKIAFLNDCDRYSQAVDAYRERVEAQKLNESAQDQLSRDAYKHYQRTGDPSEIYRLQKLGIYKVGVPL